MTQRYFCANCIHSISYIYIKTIFDIYWITGCLKTFFSTFFNLLKIVKSSSFAGQIMTKFFNNKYDCLLSNFSLNLGHKPIHKINYKREASILFNWPMIGRMASFFIGTIRSFQTNRVKTLQLKKITLMVYSIRLKEKQT